jgi:hypothetical protein
MIDRESVADDPFVGDDVGRPAAAVEQGHLAEGEPWTQRCDPHEILPVGLAVGAGETQANRCRGPG